MNRKNVEQGDSNKYEEILTIFHDDGTYETYGDEHKGTHSFNIYIEMNSIHAALYSAYKSKANIAEYDGHIIAKTKKGIFETLSNLLDIADAKLNQKYKTLKHVDDLIKSVNKTIALGE